MILERHYDDETLIELLGSRHADTARDPHLAVCNSCSGKLASYRAIAEVLGEDAAWELIDLRQDAVPETITNLKTFSSSAAAEDAAAADAVAELLQRPRAEWLAAVGQCPQTPGLVRMLVAASEKAIDGVPADALAIARLATQVARGLASKMFPSDTVARSRGTAWRQCAYAAYYVGDYPEAMKAADEAQKAFELCFVSDYELARVAIVRGLILSAQERHDEALAAAREAADVFSAFGDRQRYAAARTAEAFSLMSQLRYREALPILEYVENEYGPDIDSDARARVLSNIGLCQSQVSRVAEALGAFSMAAAMYDELGNAPEAARTRYNIAAVLAVQGQHDEAKARFRVLRDEFQRLGMLHMAVSAGLELAELLLIGRAYPEAEELCAAAVEQFQKIGLSATTEGLTALMYLREATAERRATPQVVRHVRHYVERLPKEPKLLFAPPVAPPF